MIVRLRPSKALFTKMLMDGVLFMLGYLLAFRLRMEDIGEYQRALLISVPLVVFLKLAVHHWIGCYRNIWRYSSLSDLLDLTKSAVLSCLVLLAAGYLLPAEYTIPRSIPFIDMRVSAVC